MSESDITSIEFSEQGECERCKTAKYISKNGICEPCLNQIIAMRGSPTAVKRRLGQLNQSENGIRMSIRRTTALETHQNKPTEALSMSKLIRAGDQQRELAAEIFEKHYKASRETLSEKREDKPIRIALCDVDEALIQYLAKKPEAFRDLSPRKFEEVVSEILKDQGHEVEMTKETRDGGLDLYVSMMTPLGKILAIVECKKWSETNPVSLEVVERFIYTIREKTKANLGVIVATTRFTRDVKKEAANFEQLLSLVDLNALTEMASKYGTWGEYKESGIWVPNT